MKIKVPKASRPLSADWSINLPTCSAFLGTVGMKLLRRTKVGIWLDWADPSPPGYKGP